MPAPSLDADIRPFWEALKEGRFTLHHCQKCGAWYFPAAYCRNHEAAPFFGDMAWDDASGRGTVFVHNIQNWAFSPAWKDKVPYVYALIELDEGPMIGSNIVGCKPEQVRVGARVRVKLERDPESGWVLPLFELAAD